MEEATLTIGQVAQEVGLNTSAIRYYERVGVLPQPERASGQRRYTEQTIQLGCVKSIALQIARFGGATEFAHPTGC